MSEKVLFGIKNLHYAKRTVSTAGVVTYATPVAIPGASEIALPPQGDDKTISADNGVYLVLGNNQGYDGTVSVYTVPDSFRSDILLEEVDDNGVMVERAKPDKAEFALLFEFDTEVDGKTKRCVLYRCTAGRCDLANKTVDADNGPEPEPMSLPITAKPDGDNLVKASLLGDSTNTTWDSWYDAVYQPTFTAGG